MTHASRREQIYERDEYRCVTCGTGEDLTLDHRIPRSRGGTDAIDNLQTMCFPCNNAKGNRLPNGMAEPPHQPEKPKKRRVPPAPRVIPISQIHPRLRRNLELLRP